jgi:hypothetical protein
VRWLFCSVSMVLAGCAGVQRVPLRSETVRLQDGRFIGPLEIPVPRRADHQGHDFEIEVTLHARCAPKLVLAFPDGETESLGEDDSGWQQLLTLRADGERAAPTPAPVVQQPPPPPSPSRLSDEPLPYPGPNTALAVDATLVVPLPTQPSGHWETVTNETWSGQLAFERERARRCGAFKDYRVLYLNAFDETGMLTLWAEVPQEILEGELSYRITELVPPKVEAPAPPAVAAETRVVVRTPPPPPKKQPPAPAPKNERPKPAVDSRATWTPGQWVWSEGQGEWVWHPGWWRAPSAPALQVEATGAPPNAGCTWASGYWTWERGEGRWIWQPGHWNAPPPLDDVRGEPPGPGAPWVNGSWSWVGTRFSWTMGHWGKPPVLVETQPTPPFSGAQWVRGDWILVGGRWVWSPGFYEGAQRPPPPKAEIPGVAPGPGAVWLQGYWRWDATLSVHVWIAGHWELPPGENYVWVPEPQGAGGLIIRGHWELRL